MKPRTGPTQTPAPAAGFDHVLVPTDLTDRTEKALQLAAKLAASRITLVHVIQTIEGLRFDELKRFYARLEKKVRAEMSRLGRRVPEGSALVVYAVMYGRRAEGIVKFAAASDVDLIALASHRVNPSMANRDWGTISYKVGILAQCPVLLVK